MWTIKKKVKLIKTVKKWLLRAWEKQEEVGKRIQTFSSKMK